MALPSKNFIREFCALRGFLKSAVSADFSSFFTIVQIIIGTSLCRRREPMCTLDQHL